MIISHSHKFIFIHIPKCGGTSITKALIPLLGKDDIVLGYNKPTIFSIINNIPSHINNKYIEKTNLHQGLRQYTRSIINKKENNGTLIRKHSRAMEIKKYIGSQNWEDYFTFSFVRDPWDRIVSLYYWYQSYNWNDPEGLAKKIRKIPDFDGFVKSEFLQQPSCSDYICDSGKSIVDFIGKLENFETDFKNVCNEIGLPEIQILKENISQRKRDYKEYYNEETIQLIAKKYDDDIKNFNYGFNSSI